MSADAECQLNCDLKNLVKKNCHILQMVLIFLSLEKTASRCLMEGVYNIVKGTDLKSTMI